MQYRCEAADQLSSSRSCSAANVTRCDHAFMPRQHFSRYQVSALCNFCRHGNVARSFEWNEEMKGGELKPGIWPIDELYATFANDPQGHLFIPHIGGRKTNPAWHHPELDAGTWA